jgi:hypothetical protein
MEKAIDLREQTAECRFRSSTLEIAAGKVSDKLFSKIFGPKQLHAKKTTFHLKVSENLKKFSRIYKVDFLLT